MTDNTRGCAGKKRKLPNSESASESNGTMGQTIQIGDTAENGSNNDNAINAISYVEFYSGVGGWTMALEEALHKLGPLLSSIQTKKSIGTTNLNHEPKDNNTNKDSSTSSDPSPEKKHMRHYELKRLAALDHSDLCVKVFSYNFVRAKTTPETAVKPSDSTKSDKTKRKRRPKDSNRQKSYSIERIPLRQLEEWSADVWAMSPPCQPHTRQHNDKNHRDQEHKKDLDDPRSKSFLKICEWLEGTSTGGSSCSNEKTKNIRLSDESLPSLIFLENVVGFESSNSFRKWRSALSSRGYRVGHFHLTPTQVKIPNDRPRYYSIAFRGTGSGINNLIHDLSSLPPRTVNPSLPPVSSLLSYLNRETKENDTPPKIYKAIPELHVTPENSMNEDEDEDGNKKISTISSFLDRNNANANTTEAATATLRVPEKVLQNQSAWCFDIVTPSDRRSSCFTHSYGRFIRGTGSILYNDEENQHKGSDAASDDAIGNFKKKNCVIQLFPPDQREFQVDWMNQLDPGKLRYFSGNELARLFGFSESFSFPSDTSLKQQWKLMGNSLNVRVASKLVELGFLLRYYYCLDEFKTATTTAEA